MLDREQLQDELAAGADGELVGVQEGAQVGAGHGEGLDELGAVGARLAGGLHLGEDHLDVLLGKARGREAGLGQRTFSGTFDLSPEGSRALVVALEGYGLARVVAQNDREIRLTAR